jgi:ribonuclease P protein component
MERRARLRRAGDFQRVWREGRSWSHPSLVLVACPNKLDRTRVGVVASRKIGKAVARNRARRLLRAAARGLYGRLMPGWDLILIARPAILELKSPAVQETLEFLTARAGLLVQEGAK